MRTLHVITITYATPKYPVRLVGLISHYKKIGYNINVLKQAACLVVNLITVGNFAFLFNRMPACQTSDSVTVPT